MKNGLEGWTITKTAWAYRPGRVAYSEGLIIVMQNVEKFSFESRERWLGRFEGGI